MPNSFRSPRQQAGIKPGDMETQVGIVDQTQPHIQRDKDNARKVVLSMAEKKGYSDVETQELLDQLGLISV